MKTLENEHFLGKIVLIYKQTPTENTNNSTKSVQCLLGSVFLIQHPQYIEQTVIFRC